MPDKNLSSLLLLLGVWLLSALAGLSFIYQALKENGQRRQSGVRKILQEIRFRLRLAAGTGLLIWVVIGVLWAFLVWQ